MSAIFASIGSDRDNCCASYRSTKKNTVLISGGNKMKATAADDGLHMPNNKAENRKNDL